MKVLFAAYRDWAKIVFYRLCQDKECWRHFFDLVTTPEDFATKALAYEWDAIVLVGWSWKVSADVVNSRLVVGMHPSDLPMYAGGSPIQNQILDGVEETKATLFKLNEKFDQGEIVDKEPISLKGHLDEVFSSIQDASVTLIQRFVKRHPNNVFIPQTGEKHVVRRLKPEHSRLPNPGNPMQGSILADKLVGEVKPMTCKELWDHIRCREDPYPNAYFEDETGKLVIKRVEFEPK